MKTKCKFCKTYNDEESILCCNCSKPLWNKDEVAEKLLNRLSKLEQKYQEEVQAIRKDIAAFTKLEDPTPDSIITLDKKIPPIKTESKEVPSLQNKEPGSISQPKSQPELPKIKEAASLQNKVAASVSQPKLKPEPTKTKIPQLSTPSEFDLKLQEFLSPISEGIELVFKTFTKYKEERKLPIFFMTIAGIIAILFGFGYLMQLSLKYLGAYQEVFKIGMGFTSAVTLCVIGVRLSKKGKTLKEYGSALISLGILLNYLMIYFLSDLGNFPVLSSSILGFFFVCINTFVSIIFSLKYEAKIISVISLIGGAFAPIYINEMGDGRLYYLYLWFLAVGSCYVAWKIEWKILNYLTFAVTLGSLEFMVFSQSPSNLTFTFYYHLFAYLFFFIALYDGLKLKKSIAKADILILAGSLSFFLYNLFNAFESNLISLGIVYTLNALIFSSILLIKWKDLSRDTKLVLFVMIGVLLGFAIPSLFDQKLMGLFWSIEALLLVVLGFHFAMPTVRKEGYLVLVIALGKLLISSRLIVERWEETLWHQGFLNYIVLGAIFISMWFIGRSYHKKLIEFEADLYSLIKEIVPIWLASVFLIVGYRLIGVWIFNLSIIPLFGFIYWKKYFKTNTSEFLGLSHLLLFIVGFILSVEATGSFHLSDQKLYAQIAIIEFMITLWALKSFYMILEMEEEDTFLLTESLRIAFFCLLPLIFINFVRRHAFEFIELGVWIGAMMTYFLSKKLKYDALKVEFYILSAIGFGLCYMEWDSIGFISGIVFIVSIVMFEKAVSYEGLQKSVYKHYIVIFPYVLTALIGSFILSLNDDFFALSLSIASLSLLVFVYFYDKIGPIKNSFELAGAIALLLNLFSILSLIYYESIPSMIFSIINLVIVSVLLNNKKNWFPILYGQLWNGAMILHQIKSIIAYFLILFWMGIDLYGPFTSILLTAHAIILLFVAMKNQINVLNKISLALFAAALLKVVFHDINGFNTTQKVIVLIILGLILLSASYGYVKLSRQFEKK